MADLRIGVRRGRAGHGDGGRPDRAFRTRVRRALSWRTSESVYEEAGPQLRLEPRGLRRHRGPRVRDRHDLGERRREHRERAGAPPRAHALLWLARAARAPDEVDSGIAATA